MQSDDIIVLGDKVELILDDDRVFTTKVEDLTGTGLFLVAVPTLEAMPAHLYMNDKIIVGFYRHAGRFVTTMEVVAFEKQKEVQYVWLMQLTQPFKQQRRDAYRLPIDIKVHVCEYVEEMEKALPLYGAADGGTIIEKINSIDLSITGIALRSSRSYESGEIYQLKIFFADRPGDTRPFLVCSEVMRCLPTRESKVSKIGMRYYGASRSRGDILSKYVFTQQQKLIKQRKLVDIG